MATWDRRGARDTAALQATLVRRQVEDAVGPYSPWWRARLAALGRTAAQVASPTGLASVPAVGERDLCPDGDPSGAAALVLQPGERGFALHAEGPRLRRALGARMVRRSSYRAMVEADTRPTSFVWAGLGLRYPIASTRGDLDVAARAGARLWRVLGLGRDEVVVCGLAPERTAAVQALELAALGAGVPALWPGAGLPEIVEALRLVPATVLALPSEAAAEQLDDLDEAGATLSGLRTLLLVGAPSSSQRAAVEDALVRAGLGGACVALAVHVPDGHRLMWGECRAGGAAAGLHTYPDLELVQGVDPETGERPEASGEPVEVALTQLGLRGSALLRWRTGDLVDQVAGGACPGCGRSVPRVLGLRRAALVPKVALRTGARAVDLRGVASALAGRADVADWRVRVTTSPRDGSSDVVVHVRPVPGADPADVAVGVARDARAAAGLLPTQVVVWEEGVLPEAEDAGDRLTRRLLLTP